MQVKNDDIPSFGEKFRRMLDNELTGNIWRFLKGSALVSAATTFGAPGAIIAGVVLLGISVYRNHVITRNFKHDLLKQYKVEIASALGKDESSLRIADLEQAAAQMNGGNNVISESLQSVAHNHKIANRASLAGSLVSSLAAAALPVLVPMQYINWFGAAVVGGFVSNAIYFVADEMAQKTGGSFKQFRANNALKALNQQSKSSVVSSEMVMQIFVEAQPKLAEQIRIHYQRPYGELPFKDKREIIARYRDIVPAAQWAEAINTGRKTPTALASDAYNNLALPASLPAMMPEVGPNDTRQQSGYSFAAKLDEQRAGSLPALQRLH
jgi:hypothetical protein